jgi:hypothetical protein
VSVDGGANWIPTELISQLGHWSYFWTPASLGPVTLKSRAFDNRGNVQDPPANITVTVDSMDRTPPSVRSFQPSGLNEVNANRNVTVIFSEAVDAATVNELTIELRGPASVIIPATISYDADSFTATLDPTEPLSAGVTYTARVNGGSADPRVKDVAGNALISGVTWTFTVAVPPQVVSTTPTDDADAVPIGVAPRARFSKQVFLPHLDLQELFLLQDAAGNPVPATMVSSVNDPIDSVAIVPQRLLQPLQTYRVTLKGGPDEPHITDLSGTPLPSDYTWSFTTAAAPPVMTIFAPDDTPATRLFNDPNPVEVGLKFRSDTGGDITGVRFYKGGPANGGEHVGHLWLPDETDPTTGTLLGSVTFTDETESGWQQALFQTPISIMANTTYVISYIAPQGNYSATIGQFASDGVHHPPLHALRNGAEGGNGVFRYNPNGEAPEMPTESSDSTNYWVDVVFSDQAEAPPQVLSTTPAPGSLVRFPDIFDLEGLIIFTATFSKPIDPESVNGSTVTLIDTGGNPIPFAVSFGAGNFTMILTPLQPQLILYAYTVTLKGGGDVPHITDAAGTPLAADYTWSIAIR